MPTYTHNPKEGGGVPTCCTLCWQCPTLMQATPGVHHRGCSAKPSGGLDATGKLLAVLNSVLATAVFCFKVSFPLLQVFMLFLTLLFKLMPSLFQKSLGNSDLWLSSTFIWAVLDKWAHSPFVKPSYTPHLHCCFYLGRWCYPGCLP